MREELQQCLVHVCNSDSAKTNTTSCYTHVDFVIYKITGPKSQCVHEYCTHIFYCGAQLTVSSRAPLTFRHRTWSCILCMGSTRGREWIVAVGVGEVDGGIERGTHIHCWMLSRSKTGGVLRVFTLIHANAGMRMRFVSLEQTLWVTEMLSVSCLDTPLPPTSTSTPRPSGLDHNHPSWTDLVFMN